MLTFFDNDMNSLSAKTVSPNINRVIADGENMYIVESGIFYGFDSNAETIVEKALKDDYVSFVKIGDSILLLGYDLVDIEKL